MKGLGWIAILGIAITSVGCGGSVGGASGSPTAAQTVSSPASSPGAAPSIAASTTASSSPSFALADGEAWIAYTASASGGRYGIHLVRPDGTGSHWVMSTVPAGIEEHPNWSPDGRRLAFTITEANGTEDVWIANADGTGAQRIVDCASPCAWADEPAWSPDGTTIAFQRTVMTGETRVATLEAEDVASGAVRVVLTADAGSSFYQPRWSPDGRALVLELATNGATLDDPPTGNSIAIVALGSPKATIARLTDAKVLSNSPDWGTDNRIVFNRPATGAGWDGAADLYTMDPDGRNVRRITNLEKSGGRALQPSLTGDGRVLFVRESTIGSQGTLASVPVGGGDIISATSSVEIVGLHPQARPN